MKRFVNYGVHRVQYKSCRGGEMVYARALRARGAYYFVRVRVSPPALPSGVPDCNILLFRIK